MIAHPTIIVACDTRWEWGRSFLRGIAAFAERNGAWDCDFNLVEPLSSGDFERIDGAHGLICRVNTDAAVAVVRKLKIPVVTIEDGNKVRLPNVCSDSQGIGKLAAEHFAERGLRRFAFYAATSGELGRLRGEAFAKEVERRGYQCEWYPPALRQSRDDDRRFLRHVVEWVKGLPKPVGVFCVGDGRSREIAMSCREAKIAVPEEVAILGVSNDEFLCRLCHPQLSSIDPDGQMIGYEAAKLLQKMIDGKRVSTKPVVVPPLGVVVRQSSELMAVGNANVSQAIRMIREQLKTGISVKEIVQQMAVSRRGLEIAFRKELGRTVHEEIALARFQRAGRLLVDGHLSLKEIAEACGICNASHLNRLMREHAGMTPLAYRRQHQRKSL